MENLDLRHRKREKKETRDAWIRSLPLSKLNLAIFESLGNSSEASCQSISIARFILSEILQIQAYNRDCSAAGCYKECAETNEPTRLLKIFEKLFSVIVSSTSARGTPDESKNEIVSQVWQYKDEGTIDFSKTEVPKTLLQTMTAERLKSVLADAIEADAQDKNRLSNLIFTCSPSTPMHLPLTMKALFDIFEQSSCHPIIMTFTRDFLDALQDNYSWDEFWTIFPIYFQPLFIIQKYIFSPIISGEFGDPSHYSTPTSCVENEILDVLDYMYNPSNLVKRVSHRELGLDQKLLSFYIAACCPNILPLIRDKFESGEIQFSTYPSLFLYLKSQNK